MQYIKEDKVLKYRPDTLEVVRQEVNLNQPGRIDEAIDILEDWVKKQPHFAKNDFSRGYLERILIINKGLVERTKEMIDKLCTFKSLMPEFYTISPKNEFEDLQKILLSAHLPQLTPEQNRIYLIKFNSDNINSALLFSYYKYLILINDMAEYDETILLLTSKPHYYVTTVFKQINYYDYDYMPTAVPTVLFFSDVLTNLPESMISEYMRRAEYSGQYVIILDFRQLKSVMNIITKVNIIELRQIIILLTEGYGCRIKAIHVVSESKMVESLTTMLKQVFSTKIIGRIHTHRNFESLNDYVPKDILPIDFGGKEKSLKDCQKDWLEALTSKEFVEYFKEMSKASTDESCRRADKFSEMYAAMPGSFRTLSVD